MSNRQPSDTELERFLHRALRKLPSLRAPSTLEQRVLGELARRAALPWWRQSFAHWPPLARAGFIAACALLGAVMIAAGAPLVAGLATLADWHLHLAFVGASLEALSSLVRGIPAAWLYEGAALAAALYALLFAIGATAYRALYLEA